MYHSTRMILTLMISNSSTMKTKNFLITRQILNQRNKTASIGLKIKVITTPLSLIIKMEI